MREEIDTLTRRWPCFVWGTWENKAMQRQRAPRRGHLDHHHSLSPASNLATSSPTRSTAAWVSTGDDTAPELSARAI